MEKEKQGHLPTKITKTWFIQRGNNPEDVFACDEQEAWGLFNNRSNWMRRDFKIVGVSDGSTYVKTIKDGQQEIFSLQNEVAALSRDLTRYLETQDKLKFTDLLPETDEKVIRVKVLVKELQDKIDEKSGVLSNAQKYVVDKAFKAELEVARGHIEMPQNFDVFTPHGDREKILRQLGK
jgi:hypothetical protein